MRGRVQAVEATGREVGGRVKTVLVDPDPSVVRIVGRVLEAALDRDAVAVDADVDEARTPRSDPRHVGEHVPAVRVVRVDEGPHRPHAGRAQMFGDFRERAGSGREANADALHVRCGGAAPALAGVGRSELGLADERDAADQARAGDVVEQEIERRTRGADLGYERSERAAQVTPATLPDQVWNARCVRDGLDRLDHPIPEQGVEGGFADDARRLGRVCGDCVSCATS